MRDVVTLFEEMKAHAELGRLEEHFDARQQLHTYWTVNCGNDNLAKLLGTWKMRMSVRRLVGPRAEVVDRSLRDHDRLVTACLERDVPLAVALMRSMTLSGLAAIKREQLARSEGAR